MIIQKIIKHLFVVLTLFSFTGAWFVQAADERLTHATHYLEQGHYFLALQETKQAIESASTNAERTKALILQGNILLLMQRYQESEKSLQQALALAEINADKAEITNSLGVLYYELRDKNKAAQHFNIALTHAANPIQSLKIQLNQLRIKPDSATLSQLSTLLSEISGMQPLEDRVKYSLNLASIASYNQQAPQIAHTALEQALIDSPSINDQQLRLEVLDSLSASFEKQGNTQQALVLLEQASRLFPSLDADDLWINIEWRKARIYQQQGRDEAALAAYRKAIDHIQTIRRDIPIQYEDGKSSFRETLGPLYLGYANLVLRHSAGQTGETQQRSLRVARQTIEQIKQSELEDFLGGRCLIEGIQQSELETIDTTAAVLYPIILPDRLELLVSIGHTIRQYSVPIQDKAVNDAANKLSNYLRQNALFKDDSLAEQFRKPAEQLYHWIITPIEQELVKQSVKTLIIVPDGLLRLVPFSALFDGQHYLIEKYAIAISPGISLMSDYSLANQPKEFRSLLAGLSKSGTVIDKLSASTMVSILQTELISLPENTHRVRGLSNPIPPNNLPNSLPDLRADSESFQQALAEKFKLPGVEAELASLQKVLSNTTLLNEQFTTANFQQALSGQRYEIVHIASHGLFSSDADNSFIVAYDDVLKLDDLKKLLKRDQGVQHGIQLLTLSACETAEGDDRAPLGFSGAALKAQAQSALGSLWPISDQYAPALMTSFYQHLTQKISKAESLRQAQLALLKNPEMSHPAIWSPFILVGNWL